MEVKEIHYSRQASYGDDCHEKFGITVCLNPDEDADEVADEVRMIIEQALQRSERERKFHECVLNVTRRIDQLKPYRMDEDQFRQAIEQIDDVEAHQRLIGRRQKNQEEMDACLELLEKLQHVGPAGDFESIQADPANGECLF